MQRDGVRRHTSDQDFVDRFFQHVQAGHAEDAIDVTADDDFQNDRRTFCHQHLVAEFLRFDLVVSDRAGSAGFAVQPEIVVVGRTAFSMFEAVREQQHASFERDRQKLPFPEEVADQHRSNADVLFRLAHFGQQLSRPVFQFGLVEIAAAVESLCKLFTGRFDFFAQLQGVRNFLEVAGTFALTTAFNRSFVVHEGDFVGLSFFRGVRETRVSGGNRHVVLL